MFKLTNINKHLKFYNISSRALDLNVNFEQKRLKIPAKFPGAWIGWKRNPGHSGIVVG